MKKHVFIVLLALGATQACKKETSATGSDSSTTTSSSSTTYYVQTGGTNAETAKSYYSTITDTGAVQIYGSGQYTLSASRIWSTGSTTSQDSSSFYGLNAAALAYNSTLTLINDSITTTGVSANGVFSYGTAVVTMSTDTIYCTGNGAHGIYAAGGGTLKATDVLSTTTGASASNIATDRGGGTVTVTRGTYITSGNNSAAIYSTGTVDVTDAILTTNGAEAVVIEGANNATLTNCTTTCNYDKWGALVYQSFSGDANGTIGTLTFTGGTFTYKGTKGGLFYNTNDTAYIYLNGVTISNACDTLVRSILGSWNGVSATSGGHTHLICSGQTISGLIYADASSKAELVLKSSSSFTGKVNPGNVAALATVSLDASSSWTLTADSYVNTLTNAVSDNSNIKAGAYHLYVNGTLVL